MIKSHYVCKKDTPFHRKGQTVSISEVERLFSTAKYIDEFFELANVDIPLDFILDGFYYSKKPSGYYHKFPDIEHCSDKYTIACLGIDNICELLQNKQCKTIIKNLYLLLR